MYIPFMTLMHFRVERIRQSVYLKELIVNVSFVSDVHHMAKYACAEQTYAFEGHTETCPSLA